MAKDFGQTSNLKPTGRRTKTLAVKTTVMSLKPLRYQQTGKK